MSEPRLLHSRTSHRHQVVVVEDGTTRYLFFDDLGSREIVSRMDMAAPATLLAPYTRAMALVLAWNRHPSRLYLIGLGAGRLPYFFDSVVPGCRIECTEIDDDVHQIAREYFGLGALDHLDVVIDDGRRHLEAMAPSAVFDAILLDAFSGTGSTPRHLSTAEFYRSCRAHLGPGGVVVLNIIATDEQFDVKIETLRRSFRYLHRIEIDRSNIVFASDRTIDIASLEAVAAEFDVAGSEPDGYRSLARRVRSVDGPFGHRTDVLTDHG